MSSESDTMLIENYVNKQEGELSLVLQQNVSAWRICHKILFA